MICITIAQESRRLALADMLNASRQCDLLEVRLDRFGKAPEFAELLGRKPKPVIMSCRRPQDGGQWDGSEQERLTILRQCIISKADYVEIELDVADEIRPFPGCKRIISYTNLGETPEDILDIYRQAQSKKPDVIKLMTRAATPEEAWPLVQIVANQSVPTVVLGVGKPGVMLTVLGKKLGAPWTFAALERGMETYPGQPTVFDLDNVYRYPDIGKGTRFVGVSGFGEREYVVTAALNGLFARLNLPARCLPLGVGDLRVFRKVMDAVKLVGLVVSSEHQASLMSVAGEVEPVARKVGSCDLLVHKNDTWHAYNTLVRAAVTSLEFVLNARNPSDTPLGNRIVVVVGANALTRSLASGIKRRGGAVIICSHDTETAHKLAQELECRYVKFEAIYSTAHDVLVVCDHEKDHGKPGNPAKIHAGYLKPGMTVMDMTATLSPTDLLREAQVRKCGVVKPRRVLLDQLALQARLLTGKEITPEAVEEAMPGFLQEDESEGPSWE